MKKSKFIAILGPTSVGKSFIEKEMAKFGNVNRIISNTTRPMRATETDGVDYNFLTDEEFDKILATEKIYEQTEYIVNGKRLRYSLSANSISDDKINVAVVNPHGLKQLMRFDEIKERLIIIYVKADLGVRIGRYLLRENLEDKFVYKRLTERLLQDEKDFMNIEDLFIGVPTITIINNGDTNEEIKNLINKIVQ